MLILAKDFIQRQSANRLKNGVDVLNGVANDKAFNTVELYFDGLIDKKEAINRLRYEKPNLQMAFRTEKALSYLKFEGSVKL